ncbi:uncharacterized protein cubi_02818 [Cryptosporidium ubiquitum]|uniref:Uncharacterized protein n=1 Tax=Cryptosporidium ubiquitum TaxID=857276 RepID=A0A1J4MIH6_9CRYT|nr:uncharacterized protein cubi_02818 [Cryptosporidium ubiquitum]OII74016.1 hypothetical protein cubi_02818 [Cryptosporidium ubiquitum]
MRFVSVSDYKDGILSQNSYLNRPNAYGFFRKNFKARSLDQSSKAARRILNNLIPELSVSQFNDSIRIFNSYLESYKNTPKDTSRIESLISASAYISVRREGGYLSLLDIASRLKSKNYRSFASLVRRICIRLKIKNLPNPSIEESLNYVCTKVEKFLKEKMILKPTERYQKETVVFQNSEKETEEMRNLMLESLIRDPSGHLESKKSGNLNPNFYLSSKQHTKAKVNGKTSSDSLIKAKHFALLILKTILLNQDHDFIDGHDDILNPLWLSNGVCSTPTISASLYFSFKLYCRNISFNDLLKATGISKSSVIKARKSLSLQFRLVSEKLFPGWLSPEMLSSNSELPPSIFESLTNLIQSHYSNNST